MKLTISEVFGHSIDNLSRQANRDRSTRACPFKNGPCTKSSKKNPLGVCTLSDGRAATAICPVRFTEANRVFEDAARLAFGRGAMFSPVPEVRILRSGTRKVGKIDYLLARLGDAGLPVDFAALEVQAVYFSGEEIRSHMDYFLRHGRLSPDFKGRRADYRSSAQKRLMPQLALKVPVFRRWGKRFFVAVDSMFFESLPTFRAETQLANSEVTWLVYPIAKKGQAYSLQEPRVVYSQWDNVEHALKEGEAPPPAEILETLRKRVQRRNPPPVLNA